MPPLLKVTDLHTSFFTDAGEVKAVNGVSFFLDHGKVLGIVGESGSGKSVTAYSIMQILASTGKIVSGSIQLDGQELVGAGEKVMKTVRGNKVSIIFQDPMTSLNPTYTIGHQLMEAILLHTDRDKKQAEERAIEMLKLVNINEPEKRMKQYPFEFSGGMRQRIMIAMALACELSGKKPILLTFLMKVNVSSSSSLRVISCSAVILPSSISMWLRRFMVLKRCSTSFSAEPSLVSLSITLRGTTSLPTS